MTHFTGSITSSDDAWSLHIDENGRPHIVELNVPLTMPVDTPVVRVGDVITIKGRVTNASYDYDGEIEYERLGSGRISFAKPEDIAHVEPRALQVGDRVRDRDDEYGTVLAICREEAAVDYGDGSCGLCVVSLTALTRA